MASICFHQIGALFVYDYPFDPIAIKALKTKYKFASTTISSLWQRSRSIVGLKDPFPWHAGPIESSHTFTYHWDLVTWFDQNSFNFYVVIVLIQVNTEETVRSSPKHLHLTWHLKKTTALDTKVWVWITRLPLTHTHCIFIKPIKSYDMLMGFGS